MSASAINLSDLSLQLTPLEPWIVQKIGAHDRLDRADLQQYQLARLDETLRHARAHSPFYRRHLADAPAKLTSLDDLAALPFTTPQDVRNNPLQFLCVSQDAIQRIVTLDSSGTTGEPKRIAFTRSDQQLTLDFFQIGMSTFTTAGDTVLILLPGERPGSVGDLLATALANLGARAIIHGPVVDAQSAIDIMQREHVTIIVGMPIHVLFLARHPAGRSLALTSALLTADHVPDAIVTAVERAWGCSVYNHYGMTEMGLGGGVECCAHRGYHVREADLLFEIIDPITGQQLPDGMIGEIVFSTLTRHGMPLIRYRTGDLSHFIPGNCPCGTHLKTLAHVRQRLSGIIDLAGCGRICMADLDEALFPIEGIVDFSATLTHSMHDQLQLEVLLSAGQSRDLHSAIEAALKRIPAIQAANHAGQLDVIITTRSQLTPVQRAKRTIVISKAALG